MFFYFRTFSLMNIHLKRRVRCWVRFDFVVQCLSQYLVTGIIFFLLPYIFFDEYSFKAPCKMLGQIWFCGTMLITVLSPRHNVFFLFYFRTFPLMNIHLKRCVRCWVRFDFVVQCLSQYLVLDIMFFFFCTFSLMNIHLKRRVRCWVRFEFVVQCLSQYLVLDIMFFYFHTFSLMNIHLKRRVRCWARFDFVVQCLSQYLVLDIMFFFFFTSVHFLWWIFIKSAVLDAGSDLILWYNAYHSTWS